MIDSLARSGGRSEAQLRPLKVTYDIFGYASSSVLFELGNTKVLCAVTMQQGVPPFLKGSGTGWLTAEYAMLPTATTVRIQRDGSSNKKNGRGIEISRLISRALRSVVDLSKMGERTIMIDCDVLQADGGTRTACITAAYFALVHAVERWIAAKELSETFIIDAIASVSAGVYNGIPILDPDFAEDSNIDADFNFVITKSGDIIEIQGTAEKKPVSWKQFESLRVLSLQGVNQLFEFFQAQKPVVIPAKMAADPRKQHQTQQHKKQTNNSLFSLGNRLKQTDEA
jgi:ribonuclease PH